MDTAGRWSRRLRVSHFSQSWNFLFLSVCFSSLRQPSLLWVELTSFFQMLKPLMGGLVRMMNKKISGAFLCLQSLETVVVRSAAVLCDNRTLVQFSPLLRPRSRRAFRTFWRKKEPFSCRLFHNDKGAHCSDEDIWLISLHWYLWDLGCKSCIIKGSTWLGKVKIQTSFKNTQNKR